MLFGCDEDPGPVQAAPKSAPDEKSARLDAISHGLLLTARMGLARLHIIATAQEKILPLCEQHLKGGTREESARKDAVSHYVLRLAYCRTEDLRRWFLAQVSRSLL